MADVLKQEGCKLMNQFGVTNYPFFAVVTNIPNHASLTGYLHSLNYNKRINRNGLMLVALKQGEMTAHQLVEDLTKTLETHGPLLMAIKNERLDRERERELRENQDRDYEVSLKRDQDREKQKQEVELRKIEEEQEKQRKQQQEEDEQRRINEKEEFERQERERKKKDILQNLAPQPEKSDLTSEVVIRLSNGDRLSRRFYGTDPLNLVISFVNVSEDMENKILVTHYPRKSFPDTSITLKDAGLFPRAVLFVEELGLSSSINK